MRIDRRWLVLPLLIVVCAARSADWTAACPTCVRIAANYFASTAAGDHVDK